MTFALDIRKFAEKAAANTDDVIAGTCLDLSRRVILRTPVDSGQARWNWQASIGSPASTKLTGSDKSGSKSISNASSIAGSAPGNIFFLTNNMPYINKLEFGGYPSPSPSGKTSSGYSTQAPNGMVRVTIREFNQIVDKQAGETK